jgi:hypothetical protein
MIEKQAIHYGQVEIIPGIQCDGYVLNDGTACLSERGTADLLGVDHMHLNRMATNGPPKTLKPFIDQGWSMATNSVEVVAKNNPYQGRKIFVYDSSIIEKLIRFYTLAFANRKLRKNQQHIGERCAILSASLINAALETAIKEACGLSTNIQQTAQKHYTDIVELMTESGLKCSVSDEIAIKTDITDFLDIPLSTLNSYLSKHRDTIKPIQLQKATIRAIGSKASRLNGYHIQDVGSIALGMDSVVGIGLKEKMLAMSVGSRNGKPKGKLSGNKC